MFIVVLIAPKAEVTSADATGSAKIKATDQTGKSISFTLKVTKPFFHSGIYIVDDETGVKASADGVYVEDGGGTHSFHLSDPEYKGVWSVSPSEAFTVSTSELTNTITVTAKSDAYIWYDNPILSVTDEAGEKTLTQKVIGTPRLNSDCYIAKETESAADAAEEYNILWKGSKTRCTTAFYLYDSNGKKIIKFPGMNVELIKSREDADAIFGGSLDWMRMNGILSFNWKTISCRKVTIKITDHWGNSVSRDIAPSFDFTDKKWRFYQSLKHRGNYYLSEIELTYEEYKVVANHFFEHLATYADMVDALNRGDLIFYCVYDNDLSTYRCLDVPFTVENTTNQYDRYDSFDFENVKNFVPHSYMYGNPDSIPSISVYLFSSYKERNQNYNKSYLFYPRFHITVHK